MRIKTSSKAEERRIINGAKRIAKTPELLFPVCTQRCKRCAIEKLKARIKRIREYIKDERKLKKLAKRGPNFCRAYAVSLLIARSEKAPYLAVAKVGEQKVAYVRRGSVSKDALIGVQHWEDEKLRLLAWRDLRYRFYSGEKLYCGGKNKKIPSEWVKYLSRKLGACEHGGNRVKINYQGDTIISICQSCAQERRSFKEILNRMVVPNPREVEVVVEFNPGCKARCKSCLIAETKTSHVGTRLDYSDKEIIAHGIMQVKEKIGAIDCLVIIVGQSCYGADVERFISDLTTNAEEQHAVRYVLNHAKKPVVMEEVSVNKLLSPYWETLAKEILYELTRDKEVAKELAGNTPIDALTKAKKKAEERRILATLPKYEHLPQDAQLADMIARCYKTKGKRSALRALEKIDVREHKLKSLAYALTLALGNRSKAWQYSSTEKEFGMFLKKYAKELLEAPGEQYDDKLKALVQAIGTTEKIIRAD